MGLVRAAASGGGGLLVVLLHYDLAVKHPPPLPQHVEEELRKHWAKYTESFVSREERKLSEGRRPFGPFVACSLTEQKKQEKKNAPYVGCRTT